MAVTLAGDVRGSTAVTDPLHAQMSSTQPGGRLVQGLVGLCIADFSQIYRQFVT